MSDTTQTPDHWCPECGSAGLDESGPIDGAICSSCGFVIEDLDEAREPVEDTTESEDSGEPVPWADYHTVSNSTEQQVAEAFELLEEFGDRLSLDPDIREEVAEVFADAAVENVPDGRPMEQTVAAAIVVGARSGGVPRPIARVASAAQIETDALTRVVRDLYQELDQPHRGFEYGDYLPYLCDELGVGEAEADHARGVLKRVADSEQLSGIHPGGVVGAALYLATDGAITQREIALAAGVSTETIRVRLQDCRQAVGHE